MIIKLFKIKHKITGYLTEENGKYVYYFGRPSDKKILFTAPFDSLEKATEYGEERKKEREKLYKSS